MKLPTLNKPKDDIHCTINVLQNIGYVSVRHERHWISTFAKFNVLLPQNADEQINIYLPNIFVYQIPKLTQVRPDTLRHLKQWDKRPCVLL